jgi:4-hydroxybenzoate polyprenyltransferase
MNFSAYLQLMRADKPVGTWLVMWPAWWGALATGIAPDAVTLLLLAAGAFLTRSAGCIINDLTDRDLDKKVERTASRPLAAGTLSVKQALGLLGLLLLASVAVCLLLKPALMLLAIPALVLIILYPRMKRITWWPQVFLGVTFNLGVFFGWFAMTDTLSPVPFLLYVAALFWTIGYDTIYAHQDMADDLVAGIKSTAIRLGRWNRHGIALCYALTATLWLMAGLNGGMDGSFLLLWAIASGHLFYQIVAFRSGNITKSLELFKSNSLTGLIFALALLVKS